MPVLSVLQRLFSSLSFTQLSVWHPIIAWFLGFSAVFGCLLGFLFGFRSAFTGKQASVTSSIPTAKLKLEGISSRSFRIFSRRTAKIVFAGLAVAVVGGYLFRWTLLHRPYTFHSDFFSAGSITQSHDGKYLAFTTYNGFGQNQSTRNLRVWDFATKANVLIYTSTSTYSSSSSPVGGITWSTDDKKLAFMTNSIDPSCETISNSNSCNGTVRIWDAMTLGNTYVLLLSSSVVENIAWSPDNASIASVSSDGTLYVWYAV